jgi:CRISPR type IV-associated protein Csf2
MRSGVKKEGGVEIPYSYQVEVPIITANKFNGGMRRKAAKIVQDLLIEKGEMITIDTYSAMNCGAVSGAPEGDTILFDEYRRAQQHPFVGLYGGGPRMMRRNVRVHNLLPITEETSQIFHQGVTTHPDLDHPVDPLRLKYQVPSGLRSLTQAWIFNRLDDLEALVDVQHQGQVIEDYIAQIQERQAKILDENKKYKEGASKSAKSSTRSLNSFEFVLPGICFPMAFELNVTDAQLGLFLETLDLFAVEERFGGIVRNGLGQYLFEDVCLVDLENAKQVNDVFASGRLNRTNAPVKSILDAWDQVKSEVTAEGLDALYRGPVEKKAKKAKK